MSNIALKKIPHKTWGTVRLWTKATVVLAKELWIPLVVAGGASFVGITSSQMHHWQENFLGFFLLAWISGQFVRVRREIDRKESANTALDRLQAVTDKLAAVERDLHGYATGGDSDPALAFLPMPLDRGTLVVHNGGEYPLHDIEVQLWSATKWTTAKLAEMAAEKFSVPRLEQGDARTLKTFEVGATPVQLFATMHSRNGFAVQEILVKRLHGGFISASCTIDRRAILYNVPPEFDGFDPLSPEKTFLVAPPYDNLFSRGDRA